MDFQVRPEISVERCGEVGRELAARARHSKPLRWQNRHFGQLQGSANRWGTLDQYVCIPNGHSGRSVRALPPLLPGQAGRRGAPCMGP
eukprot:3049794-Amphidinium_carterae.1